MTAKKTKAWEQLLADRAMGVQRAPEEQEQLLAEAREAARPSAPGWAEQIAGRATQQRQPHPPGRTFAGALREQLLGRPDEDDGPSAA